MAATAELRGKISLENAEFLRKMRESAAAGKDFAKEITKYALGAAAAFVGIHASIEGLEDVFRKLKDTFELGSEINALHKQTGLATASIVSMQKALRENGISADELGNRIAKMQKSLNGVNEQGKSTKEAFDAIGLSMEKLKAISPEQQFKEIGLAIGSLEDPADRATVTMDIFGKSSQNMIRLFSNAGALSGMGVQLQGAAGDLARNAQLFDDTSTELKKTGDVIQGFFTGLAEPIAKTLLPFLQIFNKQDFSMAGWRFGEGIAKGMRILYNAFKEGTLWDMVKEGMEIAFKSGINYLIGGLVTFQDALTGIMRDTLANPDFYQGMAKALEGVAEVFVGTMAKAYQNPLAKAQQAMAIAAFDNTSEGGWARWDEMKKKSNSSEQVKYITEKQTAAAKAQLETAHQVATPEAINQKIAENTKAAYAGREDLKKNFETPDLFGMRSEDWKTKGTSDLGKAQSMLTPIFKNMGESVGTSIKAYTPANVFKGLEAQKESFKGKLNALDVPIPAHDEPYSPSYRAPGELTTDEDGNSAPKSSGKKGGPRAHLNRHLARANLGGMSSTRGRRNGGMAFGNDIFEGSLISKQGMGTGGSSLGIGKEFGATSKEDLDKFFKSSASLGATEMEKMNSPKNIKDSPYKKPSIDERIAAATEMVASLIKTQTAVLEAGLLS